MVDASLTELSKFIKLTLLHKMHTTFFLLFNFFKHSKGPLGEIG
jgi:hypothetical protein